MWSWSASHSPTEPQIISGACFVLAYVLLTSPLTRFFRWATELEKFFRQILTPISYLQILILAIVSGLIEEWFFRGVLLNHFGLVFSSLIFGLSHLILMPSVWIWSLMTTLIGYGLGLFYMNSHSLGLVAMMHAAINGAILWRLNRIAHHRPAMR